MPMAGVPYHKIDIYLRILLGKGIGVVKQEQASIMSIHSQRCVATMSL